MLRGLFRRIEQLITRRARVDDELFDELEEALIEGDVGVQTAMRLVQELREAARRERMSTPEEVRQQLRVQVEAILRRPEAANGIRWAETPPTLVMVVGVNGTGKTTSIGKLAQMLRRQGRKVVLAAADTFRAAAIDQLELWSQRVGVEMIRHREGADPAAVVFDAVQAARARGADVVIADTAGRLHTKTNLMEELRKVNRVAERALERPADEVLLVLDATIGQNAVSQARSFAEALPVSGIILTKLDGSARGGVIVTVVDELGLPIKFAGTGEKADDLAPFSPERFAQALFGEEAEAAEAAEPPAARAPWEGEAPAAPFEARGKGEEARGEGAGGSAGASPSQPDTTWQVPPPAPAEPEPAAAEVPVEEPEPEPEATTEAEPPKRPAWKRWFGG